MSREFGEKIRRSGAAVTPGRPTAPSEGSGRGPDRPASRWGRHAALGGDAVGGRGSADPVATGGDGRTPFAQALGEVVPLRHREHW